MSTAPIDPVMAESSPKWSTEGQYGDHAVAREIGRELREARLAGGKRIANIAEQLRIRADYLDALERGSSSGSRREPTPLDSSGATAPISASTAKDWSAA